MHNPPAGFSPPPADKAGRRSRILQCRLLLASHPLFQGLDENRLSRIALGTTIIEAPRGTVLFRRDDPCHGFHLVASGLVKLAAAANNGGEKVIELLGPGQSLGEAVMFLEIPYRISAEAIADSTLLHVGRDAVFAELDRDPRLARRMLANLSMRLHHLVADLESQALRSGTQRVIDFLETLVANKDLPDAEITLPARKNIIASRLNITHEHFSRILHGLASAGLIVMQGQSILIPDREALRRHDNPPAAAEART